MNAPFVSFVSLSVTTMPFIVTLSPGNLARMVPEKNGPRSAASDSAARAARRRDMKQPMAARVFFMVNVRKLPVVAGYLSRDRRAEPAANSAACLTPSPQRVRAEFRRWGERPREPASLDSG